MDKTFSVAGVSVLDGVMKVRFANDMNRVKVLEKHGHTKVKLVELPESMTKEEAATYLVEHEQFQDKNIQATLRAYLSVTEGEEEELTPAPAARRGRPPKTEAKEPAESKPTTRIREPLPKDKYETPVRPVGAAKAMADAKAKTKAAMKASRAKKVAGEEVSEAEPAKSEVAAVSADSTHNAAVLKKAYKTWQEQRDTVGEQMLAEANAKIDSWGK